jgi:RHS repeat-associated protein
VKARGDAGWQRRHVTHYTGIGTEVRENFTGKSMQGECSENALVYFHCRAAGDCALRNELDDETQLNYFGARYFDPFFGLWMSPDPAGQFANPYSYGGDPVNFVDPNGEYRTINRKG